MKIFGITGTLGAGKGTIVEYLVNRYNFKHYSVRAYITEEIVRRELPVNRDSMVLVANDLRAKKSPSYIIDQLVLKANESNENCIIESIRTPGEVDSLRTNEGFRLLAVDADPEIRYSRISSRKSSTDNVSYSQFVANEQREMDSVDPNKQNLHKCIEMADFHLLNNGSVEELFAQIEKIILEIETTSGK